jgi:hypothetical protein
MAKRIPNPNRTTERVQAVQAKSLDVATARDEHGDPLVVLALTLDGDSPPLAWRFRTARDVDNLIQMLLRHKRLTWPEAP